MKSLSLQEFKPTIYFLLKFIGLYIILNVAYGLFITMFEPSPDPVTRLVTNHSAAILELFDYPVEAHDSLNRPTTMLSLDGTNVLAVYEGCNGLNTAIIFISFLIAFGPVNRLMFAFAFFGLLIIHLANLFRICLLFFIARNYPEYMYFTHKYFFTALLYAVVFVLWALWVNRGKFSQAAAQ